MAYLSSDKVKLYPSAYRGVCETSGGTSLYNPESRLPSEFNVSGQTAHIADSFVISPAADTVGTEYSLSQTINLEFVIHGYWFSISDIKIQDIISGTPNNIYAYIKVNNRYSIVNDNFDYPDISLRSLDSQTDSLDNSSNKFTGLDFTDTTEASGLTENYFFLKLFEKKSDSIYCIPEESWTKISTRDIKDGFNSKSLYSQVTTGELKVSDNSINFGCEYNEYDILQNYINVNYDKSSNSIGVDRYDSNSKNYFVSFNLPAGQLDWKYNNSTSRTLLLPKDSSEASTDTNRDKTLTTQKYVFDNYVQLTKNESISGYKNFTNGFCSNFIRTNNIYNFNTSTLTLSCENTDNKIDITDSLLKLSCGSTYISDITIGTNVIDVRAGYSSNSNTSSGSVNIFCGGVHISGDVYANSYDALSDRRLKENIKSFEPHKSILDLDIVEFDFKSDKSHHIGCIAQELQEICPEIVHENEDGYLSIEENKIVYLLLDEVKKLKKEIEELRK